MDSITQYNAFRAHPNCNIPILHSFLRKNIIPFYGYTWFVYPFIGWRTFGLFPISRKFFWKLLFQWSPVYVVFVNCAFNTKSFKTVPRPLFLLRANNFKDRAHEYSTLKDKWKQTPNKNLEFFQSHVVCLISENRSLNDCYIDLTSFLSPLGKELEELPVREG